MLIEKRSIHVFMAKREMEIKFQKNFNKKKFGKMRKFNFIVSILNISQHSLIIL